MQAAPPGARASSPTPAAPEDPETGEPVADQGAARSPAGLALPPGPGDALEHRPGRPRQQSQGADLGPAGVPVRRRPLRAGEPLVRVGVEGHQRVHRCSVTGGAG